MYDLNVKLRSNDRDRISLLKRATELGWSCIVWNTCVVGKVNAAKVKLPKPVTIPRVDLDEVLLNRALATSSETSNIYQFNRITITVDEVYDAQAITSSNEALKPFDIVAVCPGNAKIFSYLCKTADVDIISIDFSHKVPFMLNKKLIDEAIKRGVYFEISYGPLLQTPSIRREMIAGTRIFLQFLRGSNLILTSGCDSLNSLRGPFDVVNMGQLLKLSAEQAKKAVSDNCELLLKHARARKLKYVPVEITSLAEYSERKDKSLKKRKSKQPTSERKKFRWDEESNENNEKDDEKEDGSIDSTENSKVSNDRDQEGEDGVWKF